MFAEPSSPGFTCTAPFTSQKSLEKSHQSEKRNEVSRFQGTNKWINKTKWHPWHPIAPTPWIRLAFLLEIFMVNSYLLRWHLVLVTSTSPVLLRNLPWQLIAASAPCQQSDQRHGAATGGLAMALMLAEWHLDEKRVGREEIKGFQWTLNQHHPKSAPILEVWKERVWKWTRSKYSRCYNTFIDLRIYQ